MARTDEAGAVAFWTEVYGHWPLTPEEVANELHDWHLALAEVPQVYGDLTGGRFSKPNTMHQVIIEAVRETQARDEADARAEGAEGFAAWLEGCGYPPPQGAASWNEMLRGYRAYLQVVAEADEEGRVGG